MLIDFVIAYFIGSIPFGYLLTKFFAKQDIRTIGSGNIGATNVLRTGNKKLAIATLILDLLKGLVVVFAALISYSIPHFYFPEDNVISLKEYGLLIGLATILGHCFPVWLKFKGGKGVATAFGVFLAAVPLAALVAATTWGIVVGFTRLSSLAALSAAAIAPLAVLLIYGASPAVIALVISILVIARHKDNIKRLINGEESKVGARKKEGGDAQTKDE